MTKLPKHQLSKDGSSTLFSNQFGQFYHNPNGALAESKHVFFETSGLISALSKPHDVLSILEIGFGTGLNFLLLLDYCLSNNISCPVSFYSVEAFPISPEIASILNYSDFLSHGELSGVLTPIFENLKKGENIFRPITDLDVELHLFYGTFDELNTIDRSIDFILHDAFSPEVNAELWSVATFKKLASFCAKDVRLATYCASSKARAAMAKSNWFIARAPGALGKREMTIASLNEEQLSSFKQVNKQRLINRFDNGDFTKKNDE